MARSRAAAAAASSKAADNKARVSKLNETAELVVHVTEAKGTKRAHTVTCKRGQAAGPFETTAHAAVNVHQATAATCCRPKLPAPLGTHPGAEPMASPASTGLYTEVADVPTDNPEATADADPARRYQLAKTEWAALRAWAKAGRTPPRPATPNLDELEAEHAAAASGQSRKAAKPRANRPAIGALPVGATEGTCTGTCGQVLPATKFPKAVVDGKRQANQRASECRACRDGRRAAAKGSAEVAA